MTAYYNEIDPYAAQWLRNLIDAGHIADGVVDERSIEDIHPRDLDGFTQCHFFAGIGVWSHALRSAGWADDRPVWTGSCPCQPFSAAGKGAGFADERHLWPAWHHLIRQCKPRRVFGEQVASRDGLEWLDLVHTDMEAAGYAFGAVDLCAAGVGAPHIRQRLFFVAHAAGERQRGREGQLGGIRSAERLQARLVADSYDARLEGRRRGAGRADERAARARGVAGALADDDAAGRGEQRRGGLLDGERPALGHDADGRGADGSEARAMYSEMPTQPLGVHEIRMRTCEGFWSASDWIPCRDGKWRPVEPGTFPLAHGAPARVGRLRAYGNAIVAPAAAAFIRSSMTEAA